MKWSDEATDLAHVATEDVVHFLRREAERITKLHRADYVSAAYVKEATRKLNMAKADTGSTMGDILLAAGFACVGIAVGFCVLWVPDGHAPVASGFAIAAAILGCVGFTGVGVGITLKMIVRW